MPLLRSSHAVSLAPVPPEREELTGVAGGVLLPHLQGRWENKIGVTYGTCLGSKTKSLLPRRACSNRRSSHAAVEGNTVARGYLCQHLCAYLITVLFHLDISTMDQSNGINENVDKASRNVTSCSDCPSAVFRLVVCRKQSKRDVHRNHRVENLG